MGMFDYSDPEIALAAGLLSGRGNLGGIMGRSLMDAQRAYLATSEDKRRNKLADLQAQNYQLELDQAQQKKKQQALLDQFRNNIPMPGVGPDGMGPSNAGPNELLMHQAMRAGALNPIDYIKAQQKDDALTTVPAGATVLKGGKPIFSNPKEDDPSPVVKLMKERAKFPPGSFEYNALTDAIEKAKSHPPGATMNNYGPPLAFVDPVTKQTLYVQPPTRPGAPSQVVTDPRTGKPAAKPGEEEKPASESERTAGFLLQRIRDSQRQLSAVTGKNSDAASPSLVAEGARQISEPLANALTEDDRQRVEAAQLDILDAALTLGTGAAYTREQLLGYRKSYFPQLGDKSGAIKDKQDRLNNLIRAAEKKAGKAAADNKGSARTVKRTGTSNGRKVVEYSDGSIEYAD
jgi:hypothetical protein